MPCEDLAYVPPARFRKITPQTDQWRAFCDVGAIYVLDGEDRDSTRLPTDYELLKITAGLIPTVNSLAEFKNLNGGREFKPQKYKVGYKWGDYEIIGTLDYNDRKYPGVNYVCKCRCGEVRIKKSSGIGKNQSCSECYARRRDGNGK